MKNQLMKFPVYIFLICLLTACTHRNDLADVETDIAAIKKHYEQYVLAANTGDVNLLISLWADDATRMAPGTPAVVGKENIRAHFKNLMDPFVLEMVMIGETEVQVSGDLAGAYGTVTLSTTPRDGGPTIKTDLKWLDILKRQADGSWKIYVDCVNLHPSFGSEIKPEELLESQKQASPY